MTKEPIMIDDVDVSECEYAEPSYTTPKCAINDWIHCDGHDCHYKQLIRKEQECEEWARKYKQLENEYEGFAVKYTDMEIALKRKMEECEEKDKNIKFLLEKLDLSNNCIQDCEIHWEKERKKLKQQLNQLKVELKAEKK